MGRPGQGGMGVGPGEYGGTTGQGVKVRGLDIFVAQYAHPVIPERIDGHKKDIRIFGHSRLQALPHHSQAEDERGNGLPGGFDRRSHFYPL